MTKREKQIIRSWAKLRTPDLNPKKFIDVAIVYFYQLNERDQQLMIAEFEEYINQVRRGIIEASPVKLPTPTIK